MADDDKNNDLTHTLGGLLMRAFGNASDGNNAEAGSNFSFGKMFLPILMMLFGFNADTSLITKTGDLADHAGAAVKQTVENAGKKVAGYAENLAGHHDNSRAIVTLGDSLTVGEAGELSKHFGNVVNLARVGAHLSEIDSSKISQVPQGAAVIMSMGINDVDQKKAMSGAEVDAYARHLVETAARVKNERGADVAINSMAVRDANPVWAANIAAVNAAVKNLAGQNGIGYTDVSGVENWANTLHKTSAGYEQMAAVGLKTLGISA